MNSTVNNRYIIINTVVIIIAFFCIALFVDVLQIHASVNAAHLVNHGIMLIQTHVQFI
jgi:hypothetical protein